MNPSARSTRGRQVWMTQQDASSTDRVTKCLRRVNWCKRAHFALLAETDLSDHQSPMPLNMWVSSRPSWFSLQAQELPSDNLACFPQQGNVLVCWEGTFLSTNYTIGILHSVLILLWIWLMWISMPKSNKALRNWHCLFSESVRLRGQNLGCDVLSRCYPPGVWVTSQPATWLFNFSTV